MKNGDILSSPSYTRPDKINSMIAHINENVRSITREPTRFNPVMKPDSTQRSHIC